MASEADFKQEYPPQSWERLKTSIRTRISVWIGTALFVGWVLLRLPPKKQRTYVSGSIQEANHRSGEIKPAGKSKQLKVKADCRSCADAMPGKVGGLCVVLHLRLNSDRFRCPYT